jgi:hypothetical protein
VLAALSLSTGSAFGQATNEITDVDPNSAAQGTIDLLVTFTLDTDDPPAPPAGELPDSVMIGTMSGISITHTSQYIVTAVFDVPGGEPTGAKDATISFTTPQGSLVFSMADGFTVTPGADMPPTIIEHPQSQTAPPGSSVTFTVVASGTEPLSYQWQKDAVDIPSATDTPYTINPVAESDAGDYRCVVTNDFGSATSNDAVLTVAELPTGAYVVVDTGQITCYDNSVEITCPAAGQAFYGQDAQYAGNVPSYALSGDGLTVYDNNTGLTWMQSPDTNFDGSLTHDDKLTYQNAVLFPATLNTYDDGNGYGGYTDWRLPTVKELYSLINHSGVDLNPEATEGTTPFIDTDVFGFAYGFIGEFAGYGPDGTPMEERIIDSQWATSTLYVANTDQMFGVNFADGRIKGYPVSAATGKPYHVLCVRGNTSYGVNDFVDNGDGTITDTATGLMWLQDDSGEGLNWEEALAWVQTKNAENYLGHDDWRLPDAKELQSIVDYSRSPDTTASAVIDPLFTCTEITNPNGQADYGFYWTSTTHVGESPEGTLDGNDANYVAFGRAMGYMNSTWVDVHGAGCQRSDPKEGDPADYPFGRGPQGDEVRIYNYVRAVRDAEFAECTGDEDCDDGVACTDDTCEDSVCIYTPNDANCPDDSLFCNGTESCDAVSDCVSSGDPCGGQGCDEETDTCGNSIPTVSGWGMFAMGLLILTAGTLMYARRGLSGRTDSAANA